MRYKNELDLMVYSKFRMNGIFSVFRYYIGLIILGLLLQCSDSQTTNSDNSYGPDIIYLEDFNNPGKPSGPPETYWYYVDDMLPVTGWNDIVPGDGYAHITIDANSGNDTDPTFPFQFIALGLVGPGHRLEMRAKGAAISGVGGFIFTYWEDDTFDEIDIEIVPDDAATTPDGHLTESPDGWTDARFNTWSNSDLKNYQPEKSYKKPIVDADGNKISHIDDKFHIYTIEWKHSEGGDGRNGLVNFLIDSVLQQTITWPVPDSPSEVILGFRQMSWTGPLDWSGTHTMLIDWLHIERINNDAIVQ